MSVYIFPGQGSQKRGMGENLFKEFSDLVEKADKILGYSIEELCLKDKADCLNDTQYAQPAIYVVNALKYLKYMKLKKCKPNYLVGHSLGEYNALFAGGAFDFETGLQLVKARGEIMSKVKGGGMVAIIGLTSEEVEEEIKINQLQIEIANCNTAIQHVVSGMAEDLEIAKNIFERNEKVKAFIKLKTSGPFHSSYMNECSELFSAHVSKVKFSKLNIPVISNVTASIYKNSDIKTLIVNQINHKVRWFDSIKFLMDEGEDEFIELGEAKTLTKLVKEIKDDYSKDSFLFIDRLFENCDSSPNKNIFGFYSEEKTNFITREDLVKKVKILGSFLQRNFYKQERVILLFPQGLEYIYAMFACWYADLVAVPLPTTDGNRLQQEKEKIANIIKDAESTIVLTSNDFKKFINESKEISQLRILYLQDINKAEEKQNDEEVYKKIDKKNLAMILYTSGSTAAPKGVLLTHEVITETAKSKQWGICSESRVISWLPQFHAFGFYIGILAPAYHGAVSVLTTPETFISNPISWFKLISKYKGTHTGAPNFAFDYCSLNIDIKETADLSLESLESLLCGGERIGYESYYKFCQKFMSLNLNENSLTPNYGMSEIAPIVTKKKGEKIKTLALSSEALGDNRVKVEVNTGEIYISCGKIDHTSKIIIIDKEDGSLCSVDRMGEICVKSPCLSLGYNNKNTKFPQINYNREEFFCTGDLGFIYDNELYIAGRKKDVIIKNGKNYYPTDIEAEASKVVENEGLKNVVFAKEINNLEEVILIQEVDERIKENQYKELAQKILDRISVKYQIEIYEISLVNKGDIPLTGSNKVNKNKCKENYIKNTMELLWKYNRNSKNSNDGYKINENLSVYEKLANNILIPELMLSTAEVNQDINLGSLGVDSIKYIRIASKISETFKIIFKPGVFLQYKSSGEIARYIESEIAAKENNESLVEDNYIEFEKEISLSYGQKSLWMQCKLNPKCCAYNIPICLSVKESIDVLNFQKAIDNVICNNPILKIKVEEKEIGEFIDFVDNTIFTIKELGVTEYSSKEILKLINDRIEESFNLEEGPLLRVNLFTSKHKETIILFTIHHLIFDGSSLMIFLNEVFDTYVGFIHNKPINSKNAALDFIDFIRLEKKSLSGKVGQTGKEYWEDQLSGTIPATELPFQKSCDRERSFINDIFDVPISGELSAKLKKLAKKLEVSYSILFLSIYKILIYRYTNQREAIVGMPVMIRPEEGFDNAIGFFINVLPIRSNIQESETFEEYVKRLQAIIFNGLNHADYPFYLQVRDFNKKKKNSYLNIFDIFFNYQNFLEKDAYSKFEGKYKDDLTITYNRDICQKGEYNLTLDIMEEKDYILRFKYNPDLYERKSIALFGKHYVNLINEVIKNSNKSIDNYEYLSPSEKNEILVEWNDTNIDFQREKTVYNLFKEKVKSNPDYKAVIYENETLTYRELYDRVEMLAFYLNEKGVKSEQHIGISVTRSCNLIISFLAVMQLGAAYIPLDPKFPIERLSFMIEDSGCNFIITEKSILDNLNIDLNNVTLVKLDAEWSRITDCYSEKKENYDLNIVNTNTLAYILYTSGSTGKPKGVMISQYALVNFLLSMENKLNMKEKNKFLAITTYCFDIAGLELYLPLIAGAECYICSEEKTKDAELLKKEIENIAPDFMQGTPITWKMLFKVGWMNFEKVKVICGGEALTKELKEYFVKSRSIVWNMYGPTETTIWSTMKCIKKDEPITIGKPIHNTQVYILDKNLNPVGEEIYGELCIAGDGISLGYYNKPELTQERFIDNPFIKGTKLYKTGDIARWLLNGEIEFSGRIDQQVKINGYRIELQEIERNLNLYSPIETSVVVLKGEEKKSLIAFYKCRHCEDTLDYREIRKFLENKLPNYMIPSLFCPINEIPITPNGKIDRNALINLKIVEEASNNKVKYNLVSITESILNMVKEISSIHDVNIDDGFFDIGGDSYTAIALVEKINEIFHCNLSVTVLFKYPSVRQLSDYINEFVLKNINNKKVNVKEEELSNSLESEYPKYLKDSIAIIGIACEFPDAKNHFEYWENLMNGKDSIKFTSEETIKRLMVDPNRVNKKDFVPQYSTFVEKEMFDANFFHISPKDAELMDPQMRLLLQNSWKAFEDAGYNVDTIADVSVFMTSANNFYQGISPNFVSNLTKYRIMDDVDNYKAWILAQGGTIPTMISNKLGLEGTSLFVNTNCSSSLSALDLACKNILSGQSEYALVGAASIFPGETLGHLHQPGLNFSSSGHCRAFDHLADGMVSGEGVAVILIKNALQAFEDNDNIYALIRGIETNNDGSNKVGYYAPSVIGQAKIIKKVLENTKINPETIDYVEAHGTGTKIGDPIEVEALTEVFRDYTQKKQFCGIGSVKTNIGHLDTVAGLAGCIKAALSLYYNEIPASIHFEKPNPNIDFKNSPFYVLSENMKLNVEKEVNRIAISSFGIGGTNVHTILEKMNSKNKKSVPKKDKYIIPLSAKNQDSLVQYTQDLLQYIRNNKEKDFEISNIAYTLQIGRKEMNVRATFIVHDLMELEEKLELFIKENKIKEKHSVMDNGKILLDKEIELDGYDKISRAWIMGEKVEWLDFYKEFKPKRISLPSYHFSKKKYWIKEDENIFLNKNEDDLENQAFVILENMLANNNYSIDKYHEESLELDFILYKVMLYQLIQGVKGIDEHNSFETMKAAFNVQDKYESWLKSTIERLVEMRYLLMNEDGNYVIGKIENAIDEFEVKKNYFLINPMFSGRIQFAEEVLTNISSILSGKTLATDVIFPNSSMDLVSNIYKNNFVADYFNETIADITESYVKNLIAKGKTKIRIFEIGSGTGGTSERIFSRLKKYEKFIEEYCYTDISRGFLIHGKEKFGKDNQYIKFRIFNVEKMPIEQKVEFGSYDIVLSTNVLHATENIRNSIKNAKKLLRENGKLFMNEINQNTAYMHLTFGLLDGWWLFNDKEYRLEGGPAVSSGVWKEILLSEGFDYVTFPAKKAESLCSQIIVANYGGIEEGDGRCNFKSTVDEDTNVKKLKEINVRQDNNMENSVKKIVKEALIDVLKLEDEVIDSEAFMEVGLDSLTGVSFIKEINSQLNLSLETICIFDYPSVNELVNYICETFRHDIEESIAIDKEEVIASEPKKEKGEMLNREPIAIIGMSGRFPQADNLDEFWEGLLEGKESIEKVSRWNLRDYLKEEDILCEHGGFLNNIKNFDSLFFHISGLEAEYMEPQQRILLEESWKALEDAGCVNLNSKRCGVFVGCTTGDYFNLLTQKYPAQAFWGNMSSIVPARIAYFLNLKGPTVAIDTACSSSLSAIHTACQSLWLKESEVALAGGIFIECTPRLYIAASHAGMLSQTGHCSTFDENADGFLPAEGVGMLVLKPLSAAMNDGDNIYGIIKGTAMNQDGKTNGITAPSSKSQEALEKEVYKKFNINPEEIQLAETHGTGTKLGDPIEVKALIHAFKEYTDKERYCAIGSVKTNIGHTQMASGVIGIIKILLSLNNEIIPPVINFNKLNHNINLDKTPFYINTKAIEWKRATHKSRNAVISSFGAGGTNVHMVIGESPQINEVEHENKEYLIALSAYTEEQLNEQVKQLKKYLEKNKNFDCGNLSYTLLTGRKHFEYRMILTAKNIEEVIRNLSLWLLDEKEDMYTEINISIARELENLYKEGKDVDFTELFLDGSYRKISLPTYPFEKEEFWHEEVSCNVLNGDSSIKKYPIVKKDELEEGYISEFNGSEYFLKDHIVNGDAILPGSVYLEMVAEALQIKHKTLFKEEYRGIYIKDVLWIKPFFYNEKNNKCAINLSFNESTSYKFEITNCNDAKVQYCQGYIGLIKKTQNRTLNLKELIKAYKHINFSKDNFYEEYKKINILYGESFQAVSDIYISDKSILAKIDIPSRNSKIIDEYVIHPVIIDSALQCLSTMVDDENAEISPQLLFNVKIIEILKPCKETMWARVKYSEGSHKTSNMDIELFNEGGELCVNMEGITTLKLAPKETKEGKEGAKLFLPVWDKAKVSLENEQVHGQWKKIFITNDKCGEEKVLEAYPQGDILRIDAIKTVDEIMNSLKRQKGFNHIVWISKDEKLDTVISEKVIEAQEIGVLKLFHLIQALINLDYVNKKIKLSVITREAEIYCRDEEVNPSNASIFGLAGTIAKEFPEWEIGMFDFEKNYNMKLIENVQMNKNGDALLYRNNSWFTRKFFLAELEERTKEVYKIGGIYVVIGGAGGIGQAYTKYMIDNYKANIIWIGRREKDYLIDEKCMKASSHGIKPFYISADAADYHSLNRAYTMIKNKFGNINGIIHAALEFGGASLERMTVEQFEQVIKTKVDISVQIARVFKNEPLDFMLFLSSINSFLKAMGQGNYSAACTFEDSFVKCLDKELNCPVKVINLGYCFNNEENEENESKSIINKTSFISQEELFSAIEILLSQKTVSQLALVKDMSSYSTRGMKLESERVRILPDGNSSQINKLSTLNERANSKKVKDIRNKTVEISNLLI